jgi:pantoate--beta-alanine ligase
MAAALIESVAHLRDQLQRMRQSGTHIGFVPTMGALHAGHATLIERARRECGAVVVSIFVNPLQFDRRDDLERYPRALAADLSLCSSLGVDVVFAPSSAEMYPQPPVCTVDPGRLAEHCCGRYRPGHFGGVATIVLKLFEMVQPGTAYFGEKDAQQLAVVRCLVRDFNVPVRIVGVPTVRESDGLALSSRNQRLTAAERAAAPALYGALTTAREAVATGVVDAEEVRQHVTAAIAPGSARLEYVEVVEPATFQPVARIDTTVIIAAAMWVGNTRLIDNVSCEPPRQR